MKILRLYILLFLSTIFLNLKMSINGDPFDFINSEVILIRSLDELVNKVSQENKIIIIFSYLNNFYGDTESDFYDMALIYTHLKRQFSHNNNILFYRVHMCSGISTSLLEVKAPAMQIYYNGQKIKSINGKVNKNVLMKAIIDCFKNHITKTITDDNLFLNNELTEKNGGDDGN